MLNPERLNPIPRDLNPRGTKSYTWRLSIPRIQSKMIPVLRNWLSINPGQPDIELNPNP